MNKLILLLSVIMMSACTAAPIIALGSGPEVWVKEAKGTAQSSTNAIPDAIFYCKAGEHPTCTQAKKVELPSK